MDIYFMFWIIIQCDIIYFAALNCASFDHWQLFQSAHVFLQQAYHLVFLNTTGYSRLNLYIPCSNSGISHSKKPSFF